MCVCTNWSPDSRLFMQCLTWPPAPHCMRRRGVFIFTRQPRNSFSPQTNERKKQAKETKCKRKKTKIKINKREIKFLLLPLGTFLISCVFCQDKLNFYERLRRRLVSSLLVAKQSQVASDAADAVRTVQRHRQRRQQPAKTLNFSHLVKFILSQVITL